MTVSFVDDAYPARGLPWHGTKIEIGLKRFHQPALFFAASRQQAKKSGLAVTLLRLDLLLFLNRRVFGYRQNAQLLVLIEILLRGVEILFEQFRQSRIQLGFGFQQDRPGRMVVERAAQVGHCAGQIPLVEPQLAPFGQGGGIPGILAQTEALIWATF